MVGPHRHLRAGLRCRRVVDPVGPHGLALLAVERSWSASSCLSCLWLSNRTGAVTLCYQVVWWCPWLSYRVLAAGTCVFRNRRRCGPGGGGTPRNVPPPLAARRQCARGLVGGGGVSSRVGRGRGRLDGDQVPVGGGPDPTARGATASPPGTAGAATLEIGPVLLDQITHSRHQLWQLAGQDRRLGVLVAEGKQAFYW